MTALSEDRGDPTTTSGTIAVANLHAQIDGLTARLHRRRAPRSATAPLTVTEVAPLVDLLLLRGQALGRIADYERAAGLAEALLRDASDEGAAWLTRARTQAAFHLFPEALADLDAAERLGAERDALDAERAATLQGVGCDDEALVLRRSAVDRRPDFASLGALAVLHAEGGKVDMAEELFSEARRRYRGVSPFPVAELDLRRGHMWLGQRDLLAARGWFDAAVRRVPSHAPALGHLAEVDAALGAPEASIARLRPLMVSSDDPEYAASLAVALESTGRRIEAGRWRAVAAARYDELVAGHPEAFAHHAAEFWGTIGGDRQRSRELAERHRSTRRAARDWARHYVLGRAA